MTSDLCSGNITDDNMEHGQERDRTETLKKVRNDRGLK